MTEKYYEHLSVYDSRHYAVPDTWKEMPTLRDQFAMAAVSSGRLIGSDHSVARMAYEVADAMLKAREEKKNE